MGVLFDAYCRCIIEFSVPVEDALDLRRQLKALEDKNMIYMQQNLDLEEASPSCHVIHCIKSCDLL